jgi:hypothetical protein
VLDGTGCYNEVFTIGTQETMDFMSAEKQKPSNPFYLALIFFGVAFAVTASAYGVMMLVAIRQGNAPITLVKTTLSERHPMMNFMEQHGFRLMLWELGLLALATTLAITTDVIRQRRALADETAGDTAAP